MSAAVILPETEISDDPRQDAGTGWLVAAIFFVGILGWSAFARVDAAVYATGKIEVVGNRQAVQHPEGGVIGALNVHEGDRVAAGDILLTLASPQVIAEERAIASKVIELEALKARLDAERSGSALRAPADFAELQGEDAKEASDAMARQHQQLVARREAIVNQQDVFGRQKAQLNEQIVGAERQILANQNQQRLVGEDLVAIRSLVDKGYASVAQARQLERTVSSLEGSEGDLQAQIARAREAIGQIDLQSIGLQRTRDQEVAEGMRQTEADLGEAKPRWTAAHGRLESTQVRAPATGHVVGLTSFTVGGVITPGQVIMEVVPESAALTIVAEVKPDDANDLRVGQSTEVRFSGLGRQSLPKVEGTVVKVSADSFADQRTGQRYFRAEVEVPADEWHKLRAIEGVGDLKPGVPAQIVILLHKRTMLQYLFEPMQLRMWRSFREH